MKKVAFVWGLLITFRIFSSRNKGKEFQNKGIVLVTGWGNAFGSCPEVGQCQCWLRNEMASNWIVFERRDRNVDWGHIGEIVTASVDWNGVNGWGLQRGLRGDLQKSFYYLFTGLHKEWGRSHRFNDLDWRNRSVEQNCLRVHFYTVVRLHRNVLSFSFFKETKYSWIRILAGKEIGRFQLTINLPL